MDTPKRHLAVIINAYSVKHMQVITMKTLAEHTLLTCASDANQVFQIALLVCIVYLTV